MQITRGKSNRFTIIANDKTISRLTADDAIKTLIDLGYTNAQASDMVYKSATSDTQSLVHQFIQNHCYHVPGAAVPFAEFYSRFIKSLKGEPADHSKHKVSWALPVQHPSGAMTNNRKFIGNLSFSPTTESGLRLIRVGGRLVRTL